MPKRGQLALNRTKTASPKKPKSTPLIPENTPECKGMASVSRHLAQGRQQTSHPAFQKQIARLASNLPTKEAATSHPNPAKEKQQYAPSQKNPTPNPKKGRPPITTGSSACDTSDRWRSRLPVARCPWASCPAGNLAPTRHHLKPKLGRFLLPC